MGSALTPQEIELIRMQLRNNLKDKRQCSGIRETIRKENRFQVPKEHPVFNGESEKLEAFIMEMELTHAKETTGEMASRHNSEFITKLVPYFKADTAARIWFKMYASRRAKSGSCLSWKKLVRDLRRSYGAFDQPDIQFEDYYDMAQRTLDVKTYIAKKCEAALMSSDLTPRLLKFGFIRGLNTEIKNYVKLQKPNSLEEAQRAAIDFGNSMKGKSNLKKNFDNVKGSEKTGSKVMESNHGSSIRKRSRENSSSLRRWVIQ